MAGLIGKKIGMTSVFSAEGKNIPCTVIETGPCVVTQVKTVKKDGYDAIQLGFEEKKEKHSNKPQIGHFKKANTSPKRKLAEFSGYKDDLKMGDVLTVDFFNDDKWLDISGISKGKGFQGAVKRWGFSGRNATHGVKHEHRTLGSVGSSFPERVLKGKKMPGRMGYRRVTVKNLEIVKIDQENNIIALKGAVPGRRGTLLEISNF